MKKPSFSSVSKSASSISPKWFWGIIVLGAIGQVFKWALIGLGIMIIYRLFKAPSDVFPMLILLGIGAFLSKWLPTVGAVVALFALFGIFFSNPEGAAE